MFARFWSCPPLVPHTNLTTSFPFTLNFRLANKRPESQNSVEHSLNNTSRVVRVCVCVCVFPVQHFIFTSTTKVLSSNEQDKQTILLFPRPNQHLCLSDHLWKQKALHYTVWMRHWMLNIFILITILHKF